MNTSAFAGICLLAAAIYLGAVDQARIDQCHECRASWYGEAYRGHIMANGQPFDPDRLTCATRDYPIGSHLAVTYRDRPTVYVTDTDCGPSPARAAAGVRIDLSRHAFELLEDPKAGIITVAVRQL